MKATLAATRVRLGAGVAVLCWSQMALAQQAAKSLGMTDDPVALPGLGRIVLVFTLVAALGIGAVLALRRFGPQLGRGTLFTPAHSLKVLERLQLSSELSVHLVQTERGRVLITAHRNSIAVVLLDATDTMAQPEQV
jgi:hypothetical protein